MATWLVIYWAIAPSDSVHVEALFAEALGFGVLFAAAGSAIGLLRWVFAFDRPRDRDPGAARPDPRL